MNHRHYRTANIAITDYYVNESPITSSAVNVEQYFFKRIFENNPVLIISFLVSEVHTYGMGFTIYYLEN